VFEGATEHRKVTYTPTGYSDHNNSVKFFITYVPSEQLQGQLQTQHRVRTRNYIKDRHNIKTTTNYRQALEEEIILIQKVNKQTKQRSGNKNVITKNYITQNIRSVKKCY
jgi:hypothetical protein